mmetsp:Transcript_4783/g.12740  ORF Transcript_4783/g.12740 Transcript_4783/m.12740 type:complete len:332 (-) Transcript_4783:603-1598(-)|eukprot:CAMPEP_0115866158 /NCGR_PEP_ID=MMETSP0287-20121206/20104_1 /TAXON_ID=412157 /ORGANISM="Chrysochromulina rotalis, Strain UIO044" /LENGTH=331 /DNA_ID=CAMNT_0003320715 /DNA_START=138 /DNA_END=1133 /DNA_ORIENTATION=+
MPVTDVIQATTSLKRNDAARVAHVLQAKPIGINPIRSIGKSIACLATNTLGRHTRNTMPTGTRNKGLSVVLDSIGQDLNSACPLNQEAALMKLSALIDAASRDDGIKVGCFVRENGRVGVLAGMLERESQQHEVLRILGNLASTDVDPNAIETKRILEQHHALPRIIPLARSGSPKTVSYALGCLQNMCYRREYAILLSDNGMYEYLQTFVDLDDGSAVCRHARGCLSNMYTVLSPSFIPDPRLNHALPSQSSLPKVPASCDPSSAGEADAPPRERALACSVCFSQSVDTALTPCFHAAFCNECALTLARKQLPCPLCRAPIKSTQRIYLP